MPRTRNHLIALISLMALPIRLAEAFSGLGTGSPEDPYQISTPAQLQEMRDNLSANYVVATNIDCAGFDFGDGKGFWPVGDGYNYFSGTLDGRQFAIRNLFINRPGLYQPGTYLVGLFGVVGGGGRIFNVRLQGVNITAGHAVAGLAGYNFGTIINCYVTGNITATTYVGDVGGLAGFNGGYISGCYASADVSATESQGGVGGLAGVNGFGAVIEDSFASGIVTGDTWGDAGGLVGINVGGGIIQNCYAIGAVIGRYGVGGLVGHNQSQDPMMMMPGGAIYNSFSTGSVTGIDETGGFVGFSGPGSVIANCFYYNDPANPIEGVGSGISGDCTPITDIAYFRGDVSTRPPMSSWDFANVWQERTSPDDFPIEQAFAPPPPPPNTAPIAICKNIEVMLDQTGQVTISASDVDNGSYDPDEGDTITLGIDKSAFIAADLGENIVALIVTDSHGLSDSCQAVVTVLAQKVPLRGPRIWVW